ncbi:hypothetical protein RR48_00250 [Papilio machaon]|uniref:Uncharacterized protein n=1 Tax=Papilio machaon TaxID=76193 RepID=A0A0N1IQT6_PAPMA|nr:hypothetical protein RR48_00250 [Papilio machaon]
MLNILIPQALKECTKTTCATYNCKSSFKKAFKANSKKACIAEFWREEDSKIGNKRNTSAVIYVNHPDTPPRITRTFVDLNLGCEDEEVTFQYFITLLI